MNIKYAFCLILLVLVTSCSTQSQTQPQYQSYTIDNSQYTSTTYTIDEYETVDLDQAFKEDRQEIESYRKYKAARELADKEKEERERIDCYQKADKNESEFYIEGCED